MFLIGIIIFINNQKTNIMKNWFLYLCLAMFSVFFACSDDKEEGEDEKFMLTVDKEKLEFEAGTTEGMMERIRVTTNAEDWTVDVEMEGDKKWFSVTKLDQQWLEVVAEVNNSVEKREGKLLIKSVGNPDKVIPVLQSAVAEATLELSKNVIIFDKAGGSEAITVTSNQAAIRLENVEKEDWFSVTLAEDNKSFTVEVKENAEGEPNETKFNVVAGIDEENQKVIEVTVKQVDAVVLNASGYRIVLDAPAGATTAESSEDWCTAELKDGKLVVSASGNVGGDARSATVTMGETIVLVEQEGGVFNPGDVFKHNGVAVGIVVSHDEEGLLVIALEEKENVMFCANGAVITGGGYEPIYSKVKEMYPNDWKDAFPAFAYCAEMEEKTGMEGWVLPSFWRLKGDFVTLEGNLKSEWPKLKANCEKVNNALKALNVPEYTTGWYWCDAHMDMYGWGWAWNLENNPTMGGRCISKGSTNMFIARCFWWKRDLAK